MGLRAGLLAALFAGVACFANEGEASTRALIVGVSEYAHLPENLHLNGPRNDTRALANALVGFGVPATEIMILADGVEGLADGIAEPGLPTRDAVLAALDALAETSGPGDLIFFYFSGHGAQQPDLDGDELGGVDEIFLPRDAGRWVGGTVENAIVDDDLRLRIDRILDAGADFFGIIDACHSATGFRALDEDGDVRARQVPPEALGIPATAATHSGTLFMDMPEPVEGRGRAAYFYAAQETEVALERRPRDAETEEVYGVFTFNLLRRLSRNPNVTYRTLHAAVVNDIKRGALMRTQTPELEGELLDEPVLRLTDAAPIRQWPMQAGTLLGGQLDGLATGTLVALYDDPAAADDEAVAHGEITMAGAARSTVEPVAWPCEAAEGCAVPSTQATAFRSARFARLVEPGVDLSVVLSEPIRLDPDDGHDYGPALAAWRSAVGSPRLSGRVATRSGGYDIAVALADGTLAFAPAGGMVDAMGPGTSPRLTLPAGAAASTAAVAGAVERIARATALHRLAAILDVSAVPSLDTRLLVSSPADPAAIDDRCPRPGDGFAKPVLVDGAPVLQPCDVVSLSLRNSGNRPLDVTVLLLGPDFAITPVWPREGTANRIHPSESRTLDLIQNIPADFDTARRQEERLVVIAVPGVGRSHTSFASLEQEGVRALADETPEQARARDLMASAVTELDGARSMTVGATLSEEIVIGILPFLSGTEGRR